MNTNTKEPIVINNSESESVRASRLFPVSWDERDSWPRTVTNGFLSPKECEDIIEWGNESEALSWGTTVNDDNVVDEEQEYRIVQTAGLPDDKFGWLYDRLAKEIQLINSMNYGYDLIGILEPIILLKYKVFEGDRRGKYDWHADTSGNVLKMRKITSIIQLNDGCEYKGCELQFHSGFGVDPVVEKTAGDLITFPSYETHRVTELTAGERYSLVCWISGPPFK